MGCVRLVTLDLGALDWLAVAGGQTGAPLDRGIRPDLPPGCVGAVLLPTTGPADVLFLQVGWAGPGLVRR